MKLRVFSCWFSGLVFSTHSRWTLIALCAESNPASTGLSALTAARRVSMRPWLFFDS